MTKYQTTEQTRASRQGRAGMRSRGALSGAVALAAVLMLGGCAGNAGSASTTPSPEQRSTEAPTSAATDGGASNPSDARDDLASMTFDVSWEDAVASAKSAFDGQLTAVGLEAERGEWVYSVDLVSSSEEYEATISATTGEILDARTEKLDADDAAESTDEIIDTNGLITPEEAMRAAVARVDGPVRSWSLDRDRRGVEFEVEVLAGNDSTDVSVDAKTGEVVEIDD